MNMTNRNMTGIPPYVSASSSTSKTITSQLSQAINATVVVNASCSNLYGSYQGNSNIIPDSCNGNTNQATFSLNNIPSGDSNFSIAYSTQQGGLISGGGSQSLYYQYNESVICSNVYYFLIDHTSNNGTVSYSSTDLSNLASEITSDLHTLIETSTIQPYIDDFSLCYNYTNFRLPTRIIPFNLSNLNLHTSFNLQQCSPELNSTFLGYDMDTSIKFFKIYSGDWSCEAIDGWRWIFRISGDENGYAITGIKAWIIIFPLVGYILFLIIRYLRKKTK